MGRKASVLFLGSTFWCQYLARLLNEHRCLHAFTAREALRWIKATNKSICLVGLGPPDSYKRFLYHLAAYLMQRVGIVRKRVIYWIGSDVLKLTPNARFIEGCVNIAGSSWLAEEVRAKGYQCEERLFPVELPVSDVLPFPDAPRLQVLCYVPDAHHDLHGSSEVRAAAEQFSDVDFVVIGGNGTWWPGHPDNIRFLGWVDDTSRHLAETHVLLRRTSHDSLSAFVREGLIAGRHVIFTYDYPGVTHVERGDTASLLARLEALNSLHAAGELEHCRLEPAVRTSLSNVELQLADLSQVYD